jgi:hypothetical protein
VQVAIRVRPVTNNYQQGIQLKSNNLSDEEKNSMAIEMAKHEPPRCIQNIHDNKTISMNGVGADQNNLENANSFTFDYVATEQTPQSDVFERVGKEIVNQCLMGYNGSIFAYG